MRNLLTDTRGVTVFVGLLLILGITIIGYMVLYAMFVPP